LSDIYSTNKSRRIKCAGHANIARVEQKRNPRRILVENKSGTVMLNVWIGRMWSGIAWLRTASGYLYTGYFRLLYVSTYCRQYIGYKNH